MIQYTLKGKKIVSRLMVPALLALVVLPVSCSEALEEPSSDGSTLLQKIEAVQEQIMAQGAMTEEEERAMQSLCSIVSHDDGLANYSTDNRMVFKDVEIAPVFNGCEGQAPEETKNCFNTNVISFIKQEFNLQVIRDLRLMEPKQVDAFFIINETGQVTGMKVRNADVTVQAEILRVLRMMPVMKPAMHNGENVAVLCSIIVKYGDEIDVEAVYIPERPIE